MPKQIESVYNKSDIACEYLDLAMQLYMEKRNYFCVIHLAAAAEELFGKYLPENERYIFRASNAQASFAMMNEITNKTMEEDEIKKIMKSRESFLKKAFKMLLYIKNAIKHMDDINDNSVTLALEEEANSRIEAAIDNFLKLKLPKSQTLWKYENFSKNQLEQEFSSMNPEICSGR